MTTKCNKYHANEKEKYMMMEKNLSEINAMNEKLIIKHKEEMKYEIEKYN